MRFGRGTEIEHARLIPAGGCLARADRVAVMEHGRLVEVASHDELVEQGDRYAGLWASWQAGLAAPT